MEPCSEWEPEITVGVKGQRQSQRERKGRGGPEEGPSESQEAKQSRASRRVWKKDLEAEAASAPVSRESVEPGAAGGLRGASGEQWRRSCLQGLGGSGDETRGVQSSQKEGETSPRDLGVAP